MDRPASATHALNGLGVFILIISTVVRTSSAMYPRRELDFQRASPSEDEYVLHLNKLSGNPDNLMEQIKDLASALQPCESDLQYQMTMYHIGNRTVTCNDGSPAGFYLRESSGSKKWLIYLEGGSFCFSDIGCSHRETRLKSSCSWPKKKTGTGILSADPEENPVWWKANVVYIPYCSSDVWSGTVTAEEAGGDHAFMGALIIDEVIKELMLAGILDAKEVVLAGSSAGGTGVLLNVDRVADILSAAGSSASVRGLADSGWFLQTESFNAQEEECTDFLFCSPSLSIKLGSKLWRSYAPSACVDIYGQEHIWKCFFGFRVYPTIRSPVFIFQWLYDEAQLTIGMRGPPREIGHLNYMQRIGRLTRVSLRNVTAVFAPACYSHMILLQSHWGKVQVRNTKLSRSVRCWLKTCDEQDRLNTQRARAAESQTPSSSNSNIGDMNSLIPLTDSIAAVSQMREPESIDGARERRSTETAEERRRRKKNKRRKGSNSSEGDRQASRNEDQPESTASAAEVPTTRKKPKKCQHKLVEHATCPHCNPTCPNPINTSTGEEMEFVHFLRFAGMDLRSLAAEMGLSESDLADVDPQAAMEVLSAAARRSSG